MLWYLFWGLVALLCINGLLWLWATQTPTGRYASRRQEQYGRGLTPEGALMEDAMILTYARHRRLASEECVARGGLLDREFFAERRKAAIDEFKAVHGAKAGKEFAIWASTWTEREMLHPAAHKAYVARCYAELIKHEPVPLDPDLERDMRAAGLL